MPDAFAVGDAVMAAQATPPSPCTPNLVVARITAVTASSISAASGPGGTRAAMYNLGAAPAVLAYAVRDGNLTVCDYMTTNCGIAKATLSASAWAAAWVPIANNVVSLRAQYGVDTTAVPMDGAVDTYNQTTPTTSCGWARVRSVRLVLAARNSQYNKAVGDVGRSGLGRQRGCRHRPVRHFGLGPLPLRVFQTVVPIRNMVWLDTPTLQQMAC